MRILPLTGGGSTYTSNVYLLLGDWSALGDVNTLIDTGRDPAVLEALTAAPTGVGKRAVEQVILTHSHYDHVELLEAVRAAYGPQVCAYGCSAGAVDRELADGDVLKAGDGELEVIHSPGHSQDSICLYSVRERVLFAGDSPLIQHSPGNSYGQDFVTALEKICRRDVRTIYSGHGAPLSSDCNARLKRSLEMVRAGIPRAATSGQEGNS